MAVVVVHSNTVKPLSMFIFSAGSEFTFSENRVHVKMPMFFKLSALRL